MLRRDLLRVGLSAAVSIAGGAWSSGSVLRTNGPVLSSGEPVLRMPFLAGTAVLCQQGNAQRPPRTHARPNCLHALDLSNNAVDTLVVVAAAAGRISHVVGASALGDDDAGAGFGNQLKVVHDDG